jgi:two-component system, OmpR family, manganese sensing sensor histidine kinase
LYDIDLLPSITHYQKLMFQATRRRLAIWYTTITAVLLLLFAIGIYGYFRNTLIDRVDDTLHHVVEVVERSLAIEPLEARSPQQFRVNWEASFRNNAANLQDDGYAIGDRIELEWFSPTGELLWSTLTEPLNIPLTPNRHGETVYPEKPDSSNTYRTTALRQLTERVEIDSPGETLRERQVLGYLRVSHPWFEVTVPSRQLIWDLSWGTGLMLVAVAASGWWLSGKAMEPVGESYQRLKQFTADASHELRSPIALIQTNVQVALDDPELASQPYRQQLQTIERLTRRLGRLVDDLLFLARQDSGIVAPQQQFVLLDAVLIEVVDELQTFAAEKQISLSLDIAEIDPADEADAFILCGDNDRLTRLFANLVENAIAYTLPGGCVEVYLQGHPASGRHLPTLEVTVKDTGIGIPEAAIPKVFDRFYRVDPARTHTSRKAAGSGLGLAIAQAIATGHHGRIQMTSELDKGTTVTVILPKEMVNGH